MRFLTTTLALASSARGFASQSHRSFVSSIHQALRMSESSVSISDGFDGGNIKFVEVVDEGNITKVILRIKPDPYSELEKTNHFQYFAFRSTIHSNKQITYVIENAGDSSFPVAWPGSTTCVTRDLHDANSWTRALDTFYADGKLTWTTDQSAGSTYFSYFPPYSYGRHLDLIQKCAQSEYATVQVLGQSLDGRDIECVKAGSGDKICWIIHRQHPGETMAEFYAEGFLTRLLGLDTHGSLDGLVHTVLKEFTFYVVPNMCPDGSVRGHLRTNACGSNLNREWESTGIPGDEHYYKAPTMERSPEVLCVLKKMDETGVDAFLDVHGDEELPYNFVNGAEGCPNWGPRLMHLQGAFVASYSRANPDIQPFSGYAPDEALKAKMTVCSNQIGTRFDCLAGTLEMPYKDCLTNPDPKRGWSPARSAKLGASLLDALHYVYPYLRTEGEFWTELTSADAYVVPSPKYN